MWKLVDSFSDKEICLHAQKVLNENKFHTGYQKRNCATISYPVWYLWVREDVDAARKILVENGLI